MKLHFIEGKPEDVELDKTRLTIGRENENDITLEDGDISGFHAEIQKDGDKLFLVDLGSQNGSFHDGKRVQSRVELKPWDKLSFASVAAEIVDPDSRRPTRTTAAIPDDTVSPSSRTEKKKPTREDPGATRARPVVTGWSLLGVSDDVQQQTFPLSAKTTAGRDEACGITLPNEMTSREHARLEVKNDRLVVEDLGSTNGTWVNGKRITGPTALNSGDAIRFDTTEFRVQGADTGKTAVLKAVPDAAAGASTGGAALPPDRGKTIRNSDSMRSDKPTSTKSGKRENSMEQNQHQNQVISFGNWMMTLFLTFIPIVNLIMLLVWAFSDGTPTSKANWAKASLAWVLISFVLGILLFLFIIMVGAAMG